MLAANQKEMQMTRTDADPDFFKQLVTKRGVFSTTLIQNFSPLNRKQKRF